MRIRLRPWPATLLGAAVAIQVAAVALSLGLEPAWDTWLYALFSLTLAGAGALILSQHPRHAVGWLFLAGALGSGLVTDLAQGYGLRAAAEGWPAAAVFEAISKSTWLASGLLWIATFLVFPDGRLPGRRWRQVLWVAVAATAMATVGWATSPDLGAELAGGTNPLATTALPADALRAAGMTLFLASFVASAAALVLRFRRSASPEREQILWFALAVAGAGVVLPVVAVLWSVVPAVRPLAALVLLALPVSANIAILRHRLYDIELVVSRAVSYATLTVLLASAFGGSVLVIGTALGRRSAVTTAGATLVVAALFGPLRARVQDRVDRRFRRARHDGFRRISAFHDDLRAGRAAPEEVEDVLREVLDDPGLELRLALPASGALVDVRGQDAAGAPPAGRTAVPVERGGVELGAVLIDSGRTPNAARVAEVVGAAVLGIEMARLRAELSRQLAEVAASRARIVAAGYEERRRLERDLHDGAQQRLVSVGLALRHVQHLLGGQGPAGVQTALDSAIDELRTAIEELREIALGLRPAQLEGGLGAALAALGRRAPIPVEVRVTAERFPEPVETAAWYIACEGLTNAVKHSGASRVVLGAERVDGRVVVRVEDDGAGGAAAGRGSGLTGLSDRVVAQGGRLRVDSPPGGGTRLIAELPCGS